MPQAILAAFSTFIKIMPTGAEQQLHSEILLELRDPNTGRIYKRGSFLGKGGFAKCFEVSEYNRDGTFTEKSKVYACKIVPKSLLVKSHQKEKMAQEISIHREVRHKHIVEFVAFFEDDNFVYIILELCRKRSLMELSKRRRTLLEPEVRYFTRQICLACVYLHDRKIIHRDLKLGNLFLSDEMEIKVGDFGLATKVDFDGERKKTLCGTPNYIAPEVLNKKGHSYEVDAWSLGCIIYTLLLGKPPFETNSLKETYKRIKDCEYNIPEGRLSRTAEDLVRRLLSPDPTLRPQMRQVLEHEFMRGFTPERMPASSLTLPPRFDVLMAAAAATASSQSGAVTGSMVLPSSRRPLADMNDVQMQSASSSSKGHGHAGEAVMVAGFEPQDWFLSPLLSLLSSFETHKPEALASPNMAEAEDPAVAPVYWISKWVDYSDKYGFGYMLIDGSFGVLFNDNTRMVLHNDNQTVEYIHRDGQEDLMTLSSLSEQLRKKGTLLRYFRHYMTENLVTAGEGGPPRAGEAAARLPFLRTWFRTQQAIVLHLSNGTLQINFFNDHIKLIVCPLVQAATVVEGHLYRGTFRFDLMQQYGCSKLIAERLRYARAMVEKLIQARSMTRRHRSDHPSSQQQSQQSGQAGSAADSGHASAHPHSAGTSS